MAATVKRILKIVGRDSQEEDRASLVRLGQRLEKDGAVVKAIVFAHSGALTEGLTPLTTFARNNQ